MNITVIGDIDIPAKEQMAYWDYAEEKARRENRRLESVIVEVDPNDNNFVNIHYKFKPVKFVRLRRITGYLVGTLDRFNNAKAAEERDRVKHG